MTSDWLTAREAARYLKVTERSLLRYARLGIVKGHVLSGTRRRVWRFLAHDLDASLNAQPVLSSPAPNVLSQKEGTL